MTVPETIHELVVKFDQHLPSARTPQEKEMLAWQIESTDDVIDCLAYELYGLTEDEWKFP